MFFKADIKYIFSQEVNCEMLLPGALPYVYWMSFIVIAVSMSVLICINVTSKLSLQTCINIHSLSNQCMMLVSVTLVLTMHYVHGMSYPLQRAHRSYRIVCILESTLSIITVLIPSTSLVFVTVVHYRAIFWIKFTYKLKTKHILFPVLVVWLATLIFATLWITFHGQYSSWYCLPFSSSFSWLSITLQSIITLVCITSLAVCVGCYGTMIAYLYKEEHIVQAMRSQKISNTRLIATRFTITYMLYLFQGILLHIVVWLPLFGYDEWIGALANVLYVLTVTVTDVYLFGYIALQNTIRGWFNKKTK